MIPPQANDLEEAVLGAIMLENEKLQETMGIIPRPECFYVDAHRKIYAAIIGIERRGLPVDLLTVTEELRKSNELELVGGAYFLTKLTMNVVSSAHVEAHARIVMESYFCRELINVSSKIIHLAYKGDIDVFELMDFAEQGLSDISGNNISQDYKDSTQLAIEAHKQLIEASQRTGEVIGIDTGFQYLNAYTKGWQPGKLVILAARPGVGKTALALNLALNAVLSDKNNGVGIFSLEMPSIELSQRILAILSGLDLDIIIGGKLTQNEQLKFDTANDLYSKLNIKVDDSASLNILQLRSKARKMVRKEGVKMIIIDYLQLMKGLGSKGKSREQEIAEISTECKKMSKDLGVPVIALSQMNRNIEKDGQKRKPQLSDLRESGAIEQDADIVIFLYGPNSEEKDADTGEYPDKTKLERNFFIAKNRAGSIVTDRLQYNLFTQKISNYDESFSYGSAAIPKESFGYRNPSEPSKFFIQDGAEKKEDQDETPF